MWAAMMNGYMVAIEWTDKTLSFSVQMSEWVSVSDSAKSAWQMILQNCIRLCCFVLFFV